MQVSKAQQKMEKKKKAKEFNTSANTAKQGKNAKAVVVRQALHTGNASQRFLEIPRPASAKHDAVCTHLLLGQPAVAPDLACLLCSIHSCWQSKQHSLLLPAYLGRMPGPHCTHENIAEPIPAQSADIPFGLCMPVQRFSCALRGLSFMN